MNCIDMIVEKNRQKSINNTKSNDDLQLLDA